MHQVREQCRWDQVRSASYWMMLIGGSLLWLISIVRLLSEVKTPPYTNQQRAIIQPGVEPLRLQTTLISRGQRIAIINHQVCKEGQKIWINNQRYRLQSVADKRIELSHQSRRIALTITDLKSTNTQ